MPETTTIGYCNAVAETKRMEYVVNLIGVTDIIVDAETEDEARELARQRFIRLARDAEAEDFDIQEAD